MTAAKHTPGPWVLCYDGQIDGPDGRTICRFTWDSFKGFNDSPTEKANARLIAAAPETAAERDRLKEINAELLALLKQLHGLVEFAGSDGRGFTGDNQTEYDTFEPAIRAAIARAEGR